jgi:hypothetical protein
MGGNPGAGSGTKPMDLPQIPQFKRGGAGTGQTNTVASNLRKQLNTFQKMEAPPQ